MRWSTTTLAAAALGAALVTRRVAVEGESMRPTLVPGDRVLAVRARSARPGALVVVRDPRRPSRLLVKRVVRAGPDGHAVVGDNPLASTDSRTFGPVGALWGRVVFRYHPAHRAGWLQSGSPERAGSIRSMAQVLQLDRLLGPEYLSGLTELPMPELRIRKLECSEAESALSYLRRLVQVRLDIVLGELHRRASGGSGELSEIIDQLPEILAEHGTRTAAGRFPSLELPDVNHRLLTAELDRIFDVDKASVLVETHDEEVRRLADAMVELERRVSAQRRGLHERLDALQAEVVRRYKSGEASVDTLLG